MRSKKQSTEIWKKETQKQAGLLYLREQAKKIPEVSNRELYMKMKYYSKDSIIVGKISVMRGFDDEGRDVYEDYHPLMIVEFGSDIYVYVRERILPLRLGKQKHPMDESFESFLDGEQEVAGVQDMRDWFIENSIK